MSHRPWRVRLICAWCWLLCSACGVATGSRAPLTPAGSEWRWSKAALSSSRDARGGPLEGVAVEAGELLRIELVNNDTVELAELQGRPGEPRIETWLNHTPQQRVILLRASLLTTSIAARAGVVRSVWRGRVADPGYDWFALEAAALHWAEGPLGTPFPELARAGRLDVTRFRQLDTVMQQALSRSQSLDRDRAVTLALRRTLALRAVRELRPLDGLPYFAIEEQRAKAQPATTDPRTGRSVYHVTASAPVTFDLEGPGIFELLGVLPDERSEPVEIRVMEGARQRGTLAVLPHKARSATPNAATEPSISRLRLHVPPGQHAYSIEASRDFWARVLVARPTVHVEDAHEKSEVVALEAASRACDAPESPELCALALALLGADAATARSPAYPALDYTGAVSRLEPDARACVQAIAEGAALTKPASKPYATLRDSAWSVAAAAPDDSDRWLANLGETDAGACNDEDAAPWQELGEQAQQLATTNWHGAAAIELVVAARCDAEAVELEVDGQRLRGAPASGIRAWHVRVRGETTLVRRLDRGRAHVYTARTDAACSRHFAKVRSPQLAVSSPVLHFDQPGGAPGLEIWLREGTPSAELQVASGTPGPTQQRVRLVVPSRAGLSALDPQGVRWTRVARTALPEWARAGASVRGEDGVAVRALVRGQLPADDAAVTPTTAAKLTPEAPDVAALTALSAQIQAAAPANRGALYLERALFLARAGRARGALADARAAAAFGVVGPKAEPAVELVSAALRTPTSQPAPLPSDVTAFGIEPDFDPEARVCQSGAGPRGDFERAWQMLEGTKVEREFDVGNAAQALRAINANLLDPRAASLQMRALVASRLREVTSAGGQSPRRRFDDDAAEKPRQVSDAWGELRPAVASGGLLEEGSFVVADAERAARARFTGLPIGAKVRLDLVCYAREPAIAEVCRPAIQLEGQAELAPKLEPGLQQQQLSIARAAASELTLSLPKSPARFVLLARIVLDRPLPGAAELPGVGWVLAPKPHEYRFELDPARPFELAAGDPRILRLRAYPAHDAEMVAESGAHSWRLPANGSPTTLVVEQGSSLRVRVTKGAASLAVAERVPDDHPAPSTSVTVKRVSPPPAHAVGPLVLRVDARDSPSDWQRDAERSPAPLTPLQENLGTLVLTSGAVVDNDRNNGVRGEGARAYSFTSLRYRRRIESLSLWANAAAFTRVRADEPTFGGEGTLYWNWAPTHTRLSVTNSYETQRVAGIAARAFRARGFAEYSYRASSRFFLLPRIGFDTVNVSLHFRPSSLFVVDDELYDPYRARRPTFVFAQALLWYAPHFDDIFYLRVRGTQNLKAGNFSHASARPGAFALLGKVDLSAFVDLTWYAGSDTLSGSPKLQETMHLASSYDMWFDHGSLDVVPTIEGSFRPVDRAYQVLVSLALIGSFRRGLRDFSSLELDFPEQRAGGVPWRATGSHP